MVYFKSIIKMSRKPGEEIQLTKDRILFNARKRVSTSLIIDANIYIGISNYMKAIDGNPCVQTLKEYNLSDFYDCCKLLSDTNSSFSM